MLGGGCYVVEAARFRGMWRWWSVIPARMCEKLAQSPRRCVGGGRPGMRADGVDPELAMAATR